MRTLCILLLCAGAVTGGEPSVDEAMERAGKAMTFFYTKSSAELYAQIERDLELAQDRFMASDNAAGLLMAVFLVRAAEKHDYERTGKGKLFDLATQIEDPTTKAHAYVTEERRIDPSKLDVWWISYFATGDFTWVLKIFAMLTDDEEGEINLVKMAAAWSLRSNYQQHAGIRAKLDVLREKAVTDYQQEFLKKLVAPAEEPAVP